MRTKDLLIRIIDAIGSSFELNSVLSAICMELKETFKVDRVLIAQYADNPLEWNILTEYTSDPNIKHLKDFTFSPEYMIYLKDRVLDKGEPIIETDVEKSDRPEFYKQVHRKLGTKSIMDIPIKRGDNKWGLLGLFQNSYYRQWTEDETHLLYTIIDYIYVAIRQAELYHKEKQSAAREALLRQIMTSLVKLDDLEEIFRSIVSSNGRFFNADICFIEQYNVQTGHFDKIKDYACYASSNFNMENLNDLNIASEQSSYFIEKIKNILFDKRQMLIINNLDEYTGEVPTDSISALGIKSLFTVPLIYEDIPLGIMTIAFAKEYRSFSKDEIEFMSAIANQASIVIYKSIRYEEEKQISERERILKELISELKPLKNIEDTFNSLLSEIAHIYNAPRAILIEVPPENEELQIKYEYLKNKNMLSVKNESFPGPCQRIFEDTIDKSTIITVPDTKYLYPENAEIQNFFKKYSIKAFISSPLVRYNEETKLLGIIAVCTDEPREWTNRDRTLLKAINGCVVNIIWETLKIIELNRLRDTFITTLTHDLQVPIIGDIKALEFLTSRPPTNTIDSIKEIINETLNNDKRILAMLKNLLEIYQYEADKKKLKPEKINFKQIINIALEDNKNPATAKDISIEKHIPDNLPEIIADKGEIGKVINIFLDNAITYLQEGGHIIINIEYKDNNIVTCVSDNGPGIPEHMRDIIFKRHEMSIETERKIGAGINLYLAKRIVEAHRGEAWYTTEMGKGTTFCFSLPVKPELSVQRKH